MGDTPQEKSADRPLECSECKKPIAVRYTEIASGTVAHTIMCADCPHLERRLFGALSLEQSGNLLTGQTGLVCGDCGTSLANVRTGSPLGCAHCYEVFPDIIIAEMTKAGKIPLSLLSGKKMVSLHSGRAPGEAPEISPTLRLLALNEALNETLSREDYEQAAWLRDQIKKLTEKSHEGQQ